MRAAALVLAACAAPAPAPTIANTRTAPPPAPLEVTLQRTACMGRCPTYTVTIRGDGTVLWLGDSNVAVVGAQHHAIRAADIAELEKLIERAHFDDYDQNGNRKPHCTRVGNANQCDFSDIVICTDTSSTIITVKRGAEVHKVQDEHCRASPLDALEAEIDRISGDAAWIGMASID